MEECLDSLHGDDAEIKVDRVFVQDELVTALMG